MVNETIVSTVVESVSIPMDSLMGIIQAIGGLLIIYVIFSIVGAVLNWRKNKEIKKMYKDIQDIKKKVNKLISKKRTKKK
ncbi:MAG: hypothetical protein WDZ62_00700 [Candidatus Pacearchaeota archaeon]